ncbi:MAG: SNF2-related protein [Nannocystaceae bacterium]
MTGAEILDAILPAWRASLPASVSRRYFDAYVRHHRPYLESRLAEVFAPVPDAPPDEWTPARRAKANIAAMKIAATKQPSEVTVEDRKILLRYSGHGGLSIDKYRDQFPPGWDPDTFGLIHEFYTPTKVARAVAAALCDYLGELAGRDGKIHALEPSAGIGRFMLALDQSECEHPPIAWTAIELSTIAGKMLPMIFPRAQVAAMSFEEWLSQKSDKRSGKDRSVDNIPAALGNFRLVVSNPPYGKRGITARFDQAPEYQEPEAFVYFLRRGLDLLAPNGIGVFLIPAGFMTGVSRRPLREKVLRRHHLMSAFRLPSSIFPGANLVTDVIFFRARGGELAEVDEADRSIIDGRYFAEYPQHVLGEEVGAGNEEEGERAQGRHRHQVLGEFSGLPALIERPLCVNCIVRPLQFAPAVASRLVRRVETGDLTPLLAVTVSIGSRIADYFAERSQGTARAVALWPELIASIQDWLRAPEVQERGATNPWAWMELRALAESGNAAAQTFLNAFSRTGTLSEAITTKPKIETTFRGDAGDVLAQAEHLYRTHRTLTIDELDRFHREQRGPLDRRAIVSTLLRADWCLDGDAMDELVPLADYVTGELWPKVDRLDDLSVPRRNVDTLQIHRQRDRLMKAIAPVEFEDLGAISPSAGYIPLPLLSRFASESLNGPYGTVELVHDRGLYVVAGEEYGKLKAAELSAEMVWFIGWLNHDKTFFDPKSLHEDDPEADARRQDEILGKLTVWDYRASYERGWIQLFGAWLREEPARMAEVANAYNRAYRGFVPRNYTGEDLEIARWGGQITLQPHQNAAIRRLLARKGGVLAFDVGVGKTYTGLGFIARAREEGWGRRPAVVVPVSLVWKWYRDFGRCLPDYRVAVIGQKRGKLQKGRRFDAANERLARGEITREQFEAAITKSEPDTPEERAQKWQAFQAGLYDAVLITYPTLDSTAVDLDSVVEYAEQTPAIRRAVSLKERNEGKRSKSKARASAKPKKVSERKKAIAETTVKAMVLDKLDRGDRTPPDPGIRWEDLGIDLLMVDEAQNFKNLYSPEQREGGTPKYMNLPEGGSKRAWQLDFRSSFVRARTGGSGVVLLSATPAKNSPLEFYNILQYVDHEAFLKIGIPDPEAFIDRYLKIETRDVLDTNFEIVRKSAVVGFQRLDELRDILDRYCEFKTAEEVGLKLPKPRVQRVDIMMDHAQEAKYEAMVDNMTKRLEAMLKGEQVDRAAILGEMVRMSLVALHSELDEGYDWDIALDGGMARRKIPIGAVARREMDGWSVVSVDSAKGEAVIERDLPRPDYHSPKFEALAERIVARPGCGHIVFCEPLAAQRWIVEILVEAGIPRERIAILNASVSANDRLTIADDFNGDEEAGKEPAYDVLVVNKVANEGMDIQVRTCAVHHVDLPWTPADLEQRNGRAYRQGNTLGTIEILYYVARGSMDGYRFASIHGKRGWLASLLESQDRDTNNPAAQEDFSPEDLLRYIARDPTKFEKLLADRRAQQEARERQRAAENASNLLRQAAGRYREARRIAGVEPERAAQLRKEADARIDDLSRVSADAWPWGRWMKALREVDGIVPADGSAPVFEGLRVSRGPEDEREAFEFGQVIEVRAGLQIGVRRAGEAVWRLVGPGEIAAMNIKPEDLIGEWPESDDADTDASLSARIARMDSWRSLGWEGASEVFRQRWWSRRGKAIVEQLARRGVEGERIPVAVKEGLALTTGPAIRDGDVLPPTAEGWERFVKLAPESGLPLTALRDVGLEFFGRRLPPRPQVQASAPTGAGALAILRRQLAQARGLLAERPREFIDWLEGQDFDRAAGVLESYLEAPTRALDDVLADLRRQLKDDISGQYSSRAAYERGVLTLYREDVFEEDGVRFVLASGADGVARRVEVEPPVSAGAPFTVVSGTLAQGDTIWWVDDDDRKIIEEAWRRFGALAQALELAPAHLGAAHDLLALAAEAIETPLCQGKERAEAVEALRMAKKYYDRARDRILMGRHARALEALHQLVRRLAETAAAVAEACQAGQQALTPTRIVVPEVDREAVRSSGDDIIDDEDAEADDSEDDDREPELAGPEGAEPRPAAAASAALEVFT